MRVRLDCAKERRTNKLWRFWAHGLRCSLALVRLMRPLRRHRAIEICKHFLSLPGKGYGTRINIKRYSMKVHYCQRAMRHSYELLKIVRERILQPLVWAAESEILGRAADISPEVIASETAKYLEACEVEGWKTKAQLMVDSRKFTWRGKALPVWRQVQDKEATAVLRTYTTATDPSASGTASSHSPGAASPGHGARPHARGAAQQQQKRSAARAAPSFRARASGASCCSAGTSTPSTAS
mmetsp:Transcript_64707/g.163878  ORF Transcript_64707/g.163878 Transcript_64707/m.163878 type:complete len:240 (+) Transcript_64707:322-1041(+)